MSKKNCGHYSGIGGQAVLEGVMMKNKDEYAVSVRKPDGNIETKKEKYTGILSGSKLTKLPFIRGVFNFIDSLVLGMQTLTYSASFYEEEDARETKTDQMLDKVSKGNGEKLLMGLTVAFSIVLQWLFSLRCLTVSAFCSIPISEMLPFLPYWKVLSVLLFFCPMWP